MAYYLESPATGNVAVQLSSAITLSSVGDYVEVSAFGNSGNSGDQYRLLGLISGYSHFLILEGDDEYTVQMAGTAYKKTTGFVQPAVGVDFVVRLEKIGVDQWEASLNGSPEFTFTSTDSFVFSQFMRLSGAEGDVFRGGLYYVETGSTGGVIHRWDANASNGTGSVLPDTVGTADATLVGFATDDSQWGGSADGTIISNIDTDNAVNQYQQCNANGVSGFSGPVTSGTLGGQPVTVVDGDWETNSGIVSMGLPGNLSTGTYSLVLSDGTDSATLSGVSYTQTHGRPAFDGLVDSNSILNGQSYTADSYFRFTGSFTNGTLDVSAGDARGWQDDIQDYYTPDAGFTGDDTNGIEFLYSDGTTSAEVPVTITVEEASSGFTVDKSTVIGNSLWGSIGIPEGALVSLVDDDGGSVTLNADGELVGSKASSVATLDVDGTSVRVFVRPVGTPVKPFYKVNWQIIE